MFKSKLISLPPSKPSPFLISWIPLSPQWHYCPFSPVRIWQHSLVSPPSLHSFLTLVITLLPSYFWPSSLSAFSLGPILVASLIPSLFPLKFSEAALHHQLLLVTFRFLQHSSFLNWPLSTVPVSFLPFYHSHLSLSHNYLFSIQRCHVRFQWK